MVDAVGEVGTIVSTWAGVAVRDLLSLTFLPQQTATLSIYGFKEFDCEVS